MYNQQLLFGGLVFMHIDNAGIYWVMSAHCPYFKWGMIIYAYCTYEGKGNDM